VPVGRPPPSRIGPTLSLHMDPRGLGAGGIDTGRVTPRGPALATASGPSSPHLREARDTLNFAPSRSEFALDPVCPPDLAFLCHFTLDASAVPRLLSFDLPPPPAAHNGPARFLQAPPAWRSGTGRPARSPTLSWLPPAPGVWSAWPQSHGGARAPGPGSAPLAAGHRQTRCPSHGHSSAESTPQTP
jgi:hypothetical protein